MKVLIKLRGSFQKHLPEGAQDYSCWQEVRPGATLSELLDRLGIDLNEPKTLVINHRKGDLEHQLAEGDVIAVFPPVSGGG